GIWMIKVKKLLGFILIGMAIYIIRPMLSESIFYFLLNTLLTSTFIYYLFFTKNKIALIKIVLITSFLLSLFSNIFLAENLLDKDKDLISFKSKPNFIVINTVDELNNLISTNNKKPIMLDFYADWCITCLEFEKFTFTNEQVRALMNEYVLLKVDVTNNTESHKKLMREFEIFGPPAIIFFNSSGSEIRRIRTIGFKNAKDFKKILRIGLKHEKEF
ncbi:MAG: thioredoxin fold domain-containing protein, partial [Nitrosomonadales bacterium]|nr:thioredoxin fold domain-containing protein [Nitrosomonadales bacterium]